MHAGVEIMLAMDGNGAAIHFGHDGPDVVMEFADIASLELLSAVAAEGARRLRAPIGAATASVVGQ